MSFNNSLTLIKNKLTNFYSIQKSLYLYNNASIIATATSTATKTNCTVHFNCYTGVTMKATIFNCKIVDVQSNPVITNSFASAIFVRYNRGLL
jgi:hypothetical protein